MSHIDTADEAFRELQGLIDLSPSDRASLERMVVLCRTVLPAIDKPCNEESWAIVQTARGTALSALGELIGNRRLLAEAIQAFGEVLSVKSGPGDRLDWAAIQNNIGATELRLSDLTGDPRPVTHALVAFEAALAIYDAEGERDAWAAVQNNLGNSYAWLGELTADPSALSKAADAYRATLKVRTETSAPEEFGLTKHNLGMLLANQSEITGDLAYLDEALGVFDEALPVFSETETPAHWGQVQNSIGHTMLRRGEMIAHRPSIDAAIDACDAALRVRSDDETPLDWAISQMNLGNAKTALFNLTGAATALIEAVAAYCAALEVLTEDGSSRDWGLAQNGLAIALLAQAELLKDPGLAADAVAAHNQALRARAKPDANRDWAVTQMNLGIAYAVQAALARDPRITEQAVDAFKLALEVYSPDRMPIDYLQTARGLGRALIRLERWHEALAILSPMSSMGIALILAEPTRQRQRLLLKHLAGVADDVATAYLRLGDRDAALNAIAEGRAVAMNLTAAIAGHADRQRLEAARSAWRVAQNVAIKADTTARRLEADVAQGRADGDALRSAREKATRATHAVRAHFAEFRQIVAEAGLDQSAAMNGSDLIATVPAGGALVVPVIPSSGEAVALILSREGPGIAVLPLPGLSQDWITGQMDIWFRDYSRFRETLQERSAATRAAIEVWNKTMAQVLPEIGAHLIRPIDTVLKEEFALKQGEAEIVLMLRGRLAALPLHAAPVDDAGTVFLDRWVVRQIAKPRPRLTVRPTTDTAALSRRLLGVTDPKGDLAIDANPAANPDWFPDGRCTDLVRERATLAAVTASLPSATHAVFYCHGGFDPTGADWGLALSDGVLTVPALRELELGACRLIMLAACETGLSDFTDEFFDLPTALGEAGARCVVASLWSIPAIQTRTMVEGLFERHIEKCYAPARALREALLELRG